MLAHSPQIVTNGLVFAYDMGNTKKSWRGKPTTNFISNPAEEMARGEFGQYRDLAPAFNTNGLVPYSLSMDIKVNKPGSVLVYMQNGSSSKYSFVNQSVNATTEYQRFYFNNLTPAISNAADTAATLATYTGYGSGVTPTVKNIQLELGSFATPFVDGTRSNTQALIDLTNATTHTASSLTYNSDGTFSFNGTNNETLISNPGQLTRFSVEIWAYPTGYAGSACAISDSYPGTTSLVNYCILANGKWQGGLYQNGWYYSPQVTQTLNTWQHIIYTFDGTNQTIYKNGDSGGSTTTYSGNPGCSTAGIKLGRRWDLADYYAGKIGVAKVYNRALTAAEVKQNFNAHRGRYNI